MSISERMFLRQVRYVNPVYDARTAAVRKQILEDAGMLVPPFALHLPAPQALCAFWAIFREPTYGRAVDRAKKEAVAAAVSSINACPFCVDAHTMMLHALGERAPASAIASGNGDAIADPDLRAVVAWARASRQPDAAILQRPPFPDAHAPELIGIALTYHYVNRMVHIFAAESPFPLAAPMMKPFFRRLAAPLFRRLLRREVRPGRSLELLPAVRLPDGLAWAQSDPIFADAFARAAAAFESVGQQALPDGVRALVLARLGTWRGEDPGPSRGWVEHAIETLPVAQRPLGRLALL